MNFGQFQSPMSHTLERQITQIWWLVNMKLQLLCCFYCCFCLMFSSHKCMFLVIFGLVGCSNILKFEVFYLWRPFVGGLAVPTLLKSPKDHQRIFGFCTFSDLGQLTNWAAIQLAKSSNQLKLCKNSVPQKNSQLELSAIIWERKVSQLKLANTQLESECDLGGMNDVITPKRLSLRPRPVEATMFLKLT